MLKSEKLRHVASSADKKCREDFLWFYSRFTTSKGGGYISLSFHVKSWKAMATASEIQERKIHKKKVRFREAMLFAFERLKLTFFEIFSIGSTNEGSPEKISMNVDFSLWGNRAITHYFFPIFSLLLWIIKTNCTFQDILLYKMLKFLQAK